nr:glycosyltransferase family 2 protein [uncultured Flavobacterium sp.]
MISILVPIFNYNAYPLAFELQKQCTECKINFEILCQDDASKSPLNKFNEAINALPNCSFISLNENLAHRENRNALAEKAIYDYLLFIDGDSIIIDNNYIQKYINTIPHFDVVYGGRKHPEKCPSSQQKLRWKYGKFIEDKSAKLRKKAPFKSLLFNNTLIRKVCFDKVKFDKTTKKYGHDDTQLSYELSLSPIKLLHIDNPVEHGDIDSNSAYLNKTKESLGNLISLYEEQKISTEYIRLISLYHFFKQTKSRLIIAKLYSFFQEFLYKNLTGKNPNLIFFNFFRIGYLCSLKSEKV